MLRAIAALALASASAQTTPTLTSTNPWWERVTVTVSDDGQAQSCQYLTSLKPDQAVQCSVEGDQAAAATKAGASSTKGQVTRLTFERRYDPGERPQIAALQPGEVLLSSRMMALAIDGQGAVKHCTVVATTGTVTPHYGCDDAQGERFEASAATARTQAPQREGYMTIMVYGHSEHVV